MSKISIIIPVYNAEGSIDRCINSILNQTYNDYEIIAINDGSKDNSLNILKKYEKKLKGKMKVINQENQGVASTRNNGIKVATGKYITFIDNDDFIDSDYLNTYIKEIENHDYDVVMGGYRRVNDKGKILESRYPKNNNWGKFTIITPWAKIYNRKFIVDNKIEFLNYGIGEDIYFILQTFDKSKRIREINYIGYNWFYNNESISNTNHKGFNNNIDILYLVEKLKSRISGKNNISNDTFNYYCIRLIIWYLLYSGRTATSGEFIDQYNYLSKYLKANFQNYRRLILFKMPAGEDTNIKMIIKLFIIIDKLKLTRLFSKVYCNGK